MIYCVVYYEGERFELTADDYGRFEWDVTKLHRLDGPAIKYHDNSESWYSYGKLHRLDAPHK